MRIIGILIFMLSMSYALNAADTPREKYYRGDTVELVIGLKAVVIDKRYVSSGNWKGWYYTVRYNSPVGLLSLEVLEPEIEKCLKESPTRPKAEKQS